MQFNTSVFVFAFLPITLFLYYVIPFSRAKNYILLLASLAFCAWGDPSNLLLLIAVISINYFTALALVKVDGNLIKKLLLITLISFNVIVLAVYKYTGFIVSNASALLGLDVVVPSIALPLGISYFTLKLITYVVDVYRNRVDVQRNYIDLALYAAMFPAITAGPIVKYQTIEKQLRERAHTLRKFSSGVRLFCIGMAKKVLLSNTVAILASSMLSYGGSEVGMYGAWFGLIAYAFQLYFDFSGYSDMAIGLAKMFGFDFEKNFNYPYISKSVTEFWRRWHISLSTFFREYIYIPMGGSRVSTPHFILNMATVWLLTGIWHGAAWNFIWWGLYYLIVLLIEKYVLSGFLERVPAAVRHFYVVFVFLMGWCLFWISDAGALGEYVAALFGCYGLFGVQTYWQIGAWQYYPVLLICLLASTPLLPWLKCRLQKWLKADEDTEGVAAYIGIKDTSAVDLCDFDSLIQGVRGARSGMVQIIQMLCDITLIALLVFSLAATISGSFSPVIYAAF